MQTPAIPNAQSPPSQSPAISDAASALGVDDWFTHLSSTWWGPWVLAVAAVLAGLVVYWIAMVILRRVARRTDTAIDDEFVRALRRPAIILLPLLVFQIVMPSLTAGLGEGPRTLVRHAVSLATITGVVWLIVALIQASAMLIKSHYDITAADNYAARRMYTQVNVIARAIIVFIILIGLALALMTFPRVRELGTSLLASAGIAGLVLGLAARPVLENLIGGVQLAITQPIALDDVVIVGGEWGRIEEITSTYVVVKIWDERRLIVPFSKFISEPFQNWTRRTADILGTVFIYADYTVPVQAVRDELKRLVEGHEKWDGKVCNVQVTDTSEQTMQMRALVSAANSGNAWDLRVYVREKLIEFLQRKYPDALPRSRVSLEKAGAEHPASQSPRGKKPRRKKKTTSG